MPRKRTGSLSGVEAQAPKPEQKTEQAEPQVEAIDYSHLDYIKIYDERGRRLKQIRSDPEKWIPALREYYRENIADFINDWGITFDQRNAGNADVPPMLPFILFPRQREWVEWFLRRMWANESGACEKSRDMGVSWLAVATTASLCLFHEHMSFGFGSRKEEYVDKLGDPKSLFWKARQFIQGLPPEFTGTWRLEEHTPHMRLFFPDTNSIISGESGDNIGRGDRTRVYIVDEAAYLERPQLVEASLSQTTNCRIDVSSANGTANPFYDKRRRWAGTDRLFTFHWRADPRKDDNWYNKQVEDLDPVVVAQEIDIDYTASVEGVLIPSAWVQAAVDAHKKLGFKDDGAARVALDVADEGKDRNACIGGSGSIVRHLEQWSGKGIDIFQTTQRAFAFCDQYGYQTLVFDSDGIGSGVRGDARRINVDRQQKIETIPYRGSDGVKDPEREDENGRLNKDFFSRRKAQAWWSVRKRFERTWKAVTKNIQYQPHELISLSAELPLLIQLQMELSQPTFTRNETGHIVVDKMPEGAASPNLADSLVMWAVETGESDKTFFAEGDMKVNAEAIEVPSFLECIYTTMFTGGKPGKDDYGTGVIYWGKVMEGPTIVIDWDYTEVEGTLLDVWIPGVFKTGHELGRRARMGSLGLFMSDEGDNAIIARKAERHGDVSLIDGKLKELDARQQAISVSTHIASGGVRLSRQATDKSMMFRGVDRNHLLHQIRGFTADAKEVDTKALLRAFVYGVSIALEDE